MKSYAQFDFLFVNIQCVTACSLEKVNYKFYTAVSLEPQQLFQDNVHVFRENSHIKSESLAHICATINNNNNSRCTSRTCIG